MQPETLSDELRRRQFLLNLSVREGQDIAANLGFVPPSPDVMDIEQADVFKRIVKMGMSGIASSISESASWFVEVLNLKADISALEKPQAYNTFLCFGLATVMKLVDEDFVTPTVPVEVMIVSEDD